MAAPTSGVCADWIDADDVASCCDGLADPVDEAKMAQAVQLAQNLMFRWSGRKFPGECERTLRPCAGDGCGCGRGGVSSGWSWFWWDSHAWSAWPAVSFDRYPLCGACSGRCDLPTVVLPGPVASVTEVVVDGVVLDPSAYRVVNYRELVRVDGGRWPTSNDLRLDSGPGGQQGTWQVTYTYGRGPGPDGETVTALFACQIAKYLCNSNDPTCLLPDRVQQIVREGVTFSLEDLSTLLDRGRTGLRLCDMWLESVNPSQKERPARVSRLGDPPRNFKSFT